MLVGHLSRYYGIRLMAEAADRGVGPPNFLNPQKDKYSAAC